MAKVAAVSGIAAPSRIFRTHPTIGIWCQCSTSGVSPYCRGRGLLEGADGACPEQVRSGERRRMGKTAPGGGSWRSVVAPEPSWTAESDGRPDARYHG